MKKIISHLLLIMLVAAYSSCGHKNATFVINGVLDVSAMEGTPIYLCSIEQGDTIDSSMVQNGKFHLECNLEKPTMGRILTAAMQGRQQFFGTLVLESGTIYIDLVSDSLSGTPLNDIYYQSFTADALSNQLRSQMEQSIDLYYASDKEEDQAKALEIYNYADSTYKSVQQHISSQVYQSNSDNILGAYALTRVVEYDGITFDSLDNLMKSAPAIISGYAPLQRLYTQKLNLSNTSEGKHYVDIDGIDFATGKPAKLSDMIIEGQVTLVDFWASWCSPCRQEISENLIRLYNTYKDKGLNIIGVDVWDKPADHQAAVESLGVNYPQLLDSQQQAAEKYGLSFIPVIMLLDQQGTIVSRTIRGDEIEAAVILALGIEKNK